MHFLLCIYFRKMWSHAVSMGSSLLLDFSFLCSFGKKKSVLFLLFTLLSSVIEQSRVLCPKWEQSSTWNPEGNPLMPCWENGKLSWMCFKKPPHIQIWHQIMNACTEALSSLDLLSSLKFLWVQGDVCSPWHSDDGKCWGAAPPSPAAFSDRCTALCCQQHTKDLPFH